MNTTGEIKLQIKIPLEFRKELKIEAIRRNLTFANYVREILMKSLESKTA